MSQTNYSDLPSQHYLHECFGYDHTSGQLWCRPRPEEHFASPKALSKWGLESAGMEAPFGQMVTLDTRRYGFSRLIYLWMTGVMPIKVLCLHQIFERYSWNNLYAENLGFLRADLNAPPLFRVIGIDSSLSRGKTWDAYISIDGSLTCLGAFSNRPEALAALREQPAPELAACDPEQRARDIAESQAVHDAFCNVRPELLTPAILEQRRKDRRNGWRGDPRPKHRNPLVRRSDYMPDPDPVQTRARAPKTPPPPPVPPPQAGTLPPPQARRLSDEEHEEFKLRLAQWK